MSVSGVFLVQISAFELMSPNIMLSRKQISRFIGLPHINYLVIPFIYEAGVVIVLIVLD